MVINISASPIIIIGPLETNYDLVYNESENLGDLGSVYLDSVILGISMFSDGHIYYDVFNWGNGIKDFNTNIWSLPDVDNLRIPMTDLWPPPLGGTGIAIDADRAPSAPPPNSYGYLVVICPPIPPSTQALQVDSILIIP